jgi:uncharacterized protein
MRIRDDMHARLLAVLLAVLPCVAEAQPAPPPAPQPESKPAPQITPSFDCLQNPTSRVEQRICKDEKLAALDRGMADAYAAALAKTTRADASALEAAQRAFIKSRNDCWKSTDVQECIESGYMHRTAELQARYGLLKAIGSGRYQCPGPPAQDVTAEFFATNPPTAIIQYAGETQLMFVAPSGSGARYTGGKRQFWEHQGVALVYWGDRPRAREMRCPKV